MRYIFLHIPKSGGSTFKRVLSRNCGKFYEIYDGQRKVYPKGGTEEAVSGHIPFGLHKEFETPSKYVTIIRNPIGRMLSDYFYMRWKSGLTMTLDEFVEKSASNLQTKVLNGIPCGRYKCGGTADFERAVENIEKHFAVVGVTERIDDTLVWCRKHLGWSNIRYIRRNTTPVKKEAPSYIIERIKEKNEEDMKLYEYAKEIAPKEFTLPFRIENKIWQTIHPLKKKVYKLFV